MRGGGAVLTSADLPAELVRLGLRPDDVIDAGAAAAAVASSSDGLAEVDRLAAQVRQGIGRFPGERGHLAWPGYDPAADPYGVGVLPLLALVVTAPDLEAFHRSHGVPAEVSARTLTELGQQAWVHRRTYGGFGLHTYHWLPVTWSGALYWLGRLEFDLELRDGAWICSTHIPQAGPLDPSAVDDSLAVATRFFADHFPERPATDFYCSSWLLDPALAAALDPASNMARFQARWRPEGDPMPGDEDALFFTFARRGAVDLATLPQDTRLQRAIVQRLRTGGHWSVCQGRIPMTGRGLE